MVNVNARAVDRNGIVTCNNSLDVAIATYCTIPPDVLHRVMLIMSIYINKYQFIKLKNVDKMEYAYKILTDELRILKQAIKEANWELHPEALKDRMKKVKDLDKAIKLIDNSKGNRTDRQVGNYEPS